MTIMSKQDEFSDAQTVTATAISTSVIDLTLGQSGLTTIDIGNGEPIYLVIQVDTAVTQTGSGTVTFSLESDSTANLATSATVHWTSGAIAKATLVAEYIVVRMALPLGNYERYLGVRYTVSETLLTGAFSAWLCKDMQAADKLYADALSV